jgi:succinylarginine dihydrolase
MPRDAVERCLLDQAKIDLLSDIIQRRYRENLSVDDMADPLLIQESRKTVREIHDALQLGSGRREPV